jgi:hypothetical protein
MSKRVLARAWHLWIVCIAVLHAQLTTASLVARRTKGWAFPAREAHIKVYL